MISVEFLITSLIVVLIPGTGVIFTVSTGITQGRKASVYAALGCTAGIIPHLLATILGLAAIMHTSALAFQTLKYAGVAYLLYIAYGTWRDTEGRLVWGINDFDEAYPSPYTNDLVRLASHDVSREYVEPLLRFNFPDLNVDTLIEMANHDVSTEDAALAREAYGDDFTAADLIDMADNR